MHPLPGSSVPGKGGRGWCIRKALRVVRGHSCICHKAATIVQFTIAALVGLTVRPADYLIPLHGGGRGWRGAIHLHCQRGCRNTVPPEIRRRDVRGPLLKPERRAKAIYLARKWNPSYRRRPLSLLFIFSFEVSGARTRGRGGCGLGEVLGGGSGPQRLGLWRAAANLRVRGCQGFHGWWP